MNTAYLLLGSNEGNSKQWLQYAQDLLKKSGCAIVAQSSVYQTAAWGLQEQPDFLNQVICISTSLSPFELLNCIQEIEKLSGRQREVKWGQRTLDIDILLYNDEIIDLPELKIPHPFIAQRRFTLVPLCEIAGTFIHPELHKTIQQLLDECPDKLEVKKL